jgi:co-chaperonin GroES (HSP10)
MLRPIRDKILVAPIETPHVGLVLPGSADDFRRGEVLAIGDGYLSNMAKESVPLVVKPGDIVLYKDKTGDKPTGDRVRHQGKALLLLRESDIWAIDQDGGRDG